MIKDAITGIDLFNDIVEVVPTHANATSAYSAWASELGVSDTISLGGLVNGDDGSAEIDVGFIYTLGGVETKLMQSTEGSIGFYTTTGTLANTSRPINKVLPEQTNVTRAYNSRSLNASMVINCKHPTADCKSFDTKWQKTPDSMIIFVKWSAYGSSTSNLVEFAMRMSKGVLEIVCNTSISSGIYFQIFLMDSTTTSGNAVAGSGNLGKVLDISSTYQFKTAVAKSLSGLVVGANGNAESSIIRAYRRSDGILIGSTISDTITGEYSIDIYEDSECYLVCLDDSGSGLNALIMDRITPLE